MIFSSLCILFGIFIEVVNFWIYRPRGMSSVLLIPPLAISIGAFTLPNAPDFVKWLIALLAIAFHFGVLALYRLGILKLVPRRDLGLDPEPDRTNEAATTVDQTKASKP
jgi:hypothetical protein